jgi:signal transduction histidine kinase
VSAFALPLVVALVAAALALRQARGRQRVGARMEGVARACHELRGALAAMGLVLSRIETAGRVGPWLEAVDALRTQQARALLATEDLEAARGERREPPVEARSTVDVEALVRRCVRTWGATHGRWRVVLDWRAGRPTVWGEAGRLGQALDNLIANALEHGAGRVTIVGRLASGAVTVSVLDLGDGLRHSLNDLRPASWRSRRGHGLAIVRRAIEDHGGRIQLVRESRGTGVQFCLPLAPESPAAGSSGAVLPASGPSGLARSA